MTTPFPFVSGAVLTAQQLNDITNLPISDKTASYTLVVGDVGKRIIMNSASATTVTVNNSIFTLGDVIEVINKGAGTCTVTAGAGVTINGSGKALSQYKAGQLLALSASTFIFIASGSAMQTQVTAFTASGTFTPPTDVTYAVAHILGGGGSTGTASVAAGGTSSVAFASGTISATGGNGIVTQMSGGYQQSAGQANSGNGGATNANDGGSTNSTINGRAQNGAYIVAGGTVTPGTGITVTVGAGGTAGTNGSAGGSGYVWIEYQVPV